MSAAEETGDTKESGGDGPKPITIRVRDQVRATFTSDNPPPPRILFVFMNDLLPFFDLVH